MSGGIAGRRHMARVAELPCAVCRQPGPSLVHHIRTGHGMAQRASDWLTVPLCPDCHQGQHGIHGDRQKWIARKLSELDALADTYRRLER